MGIWHSTGDTADDTHTAYQSAGAGVHWLWYQSQRPAAPTLQDTAPPPMWEMRILLLAGVSGVNQRMGDLLFLYFKWIKISKNLKLCTSSLFQTSNSATATRYLSYVSCVGIFRWVLKTMPWRMAERLDPEVSLMVWNPGSSEFCGNGQVTYSAISQFPHWKMETTTNAFKQWKLFSAFWLLENSEPCWKLSFNDCIDPVVYTLIFFPLLLNCYFFICN